MNIFDRIRDRITPKVRSKVLSQMAEMTKDRTISIDIPFELTIDFEDEFLSDDEIKRRLIDHLEMIFQSWRTATQNNSNVSQFDTIIGTDDEGWEKINTYNYKIKQ